MKHSCIPQKFTQNGQLDFSLNSGGARTISISSVLTTVYNHPITLIGVGYDELHNMGVEGCAGFSLPTSRRRNNVIFHIIWLLFPSSI